MRFSAILFGLILTCAAVALAVPPPLLQDDDVRGAFITSRKEKPATSGAAATTRPKRKRPVTPVSSSNSAKNPDKTPDKTSNSSSSGSKTSRPESRPVNTPRIGLGLTLFSRDSNGLAVRVDPTREFRKGDRVRILLETNADGYLYVFNQTNDGPPVLIYPNAELDEGGNYLQAHVPFEIPASDNADERLRWFAFDENTGTERVFFVFTREPLKDVPIEDDLLAFCRNNKCPWPVATEVWDLVQKQMQEPLKIKRSERFGTTQTTGEQTATTRGLGLSKDDPEPSLIMMASSTRPTLVATLDLIHK